MNERPLENALHISDLSGLRGFDPRTYRRLYWGPEFCQRLLPGIPATGRLCAYARTQGCAVSLVFPFVTEPGLEKVLSVCAWLVKNKLSPEIIANDWGIIHALHERYPGVFTVALGRLLSRQQRVPAMKQLLGTQPPVAVKSRDGKRIGVFFHQQPGPACQQAMRSTYADAPMAQALLRRLGIGRIELNNVAQGLLLRGGRMACSLYTPFVHVSTTRYCPMDTPGEQRLRIVPCARPCRSRAELLRSRHVPFTLIKRGNSVFYYSPAGHTQLPRQVDRLVFQGQGTP